MSGKDWGEIERIGGEDERKGLGGDDRRKR